MSKEQRVKHLENMYRKSCVECRRSLHLFKPVNGSLHQVCDWCGLDNTAVSLAKSKATKRRNSIKPRRPRVQTSLIKRVLGIMRESMKLGIMAIIFPVFALGAMTADPIVYTREVPPTIETTEPQPETRHLTNKEKYLPLVIEASKRHGISPSTTERYIDCENKSWDPEQQSLIRYSFSDPKRGIVKGAQEESYGLAMWHVPEGEVTEAQAKDPAYAVDKMAQSLANGETWRWAICTKKIKSSKI